MSRTSSEGHDAATDSGRESVASLISHKQPILGDVIRDLTSIVARKDEEIRHLSEKNSALQNALTLSEQKKNNATAEIQLQSALEQLRLQKEVTDGLTRKIQRLDRDIEKLHEQERSLKRQLDECKSDLCARDKTIRAMKDPFEKASGMLRAYEEATKNVNGAGSNEQDENDDVVVLEDSPLEQTGTTVLLVDDDRDYNQESQRPMGRMVQLASTSADILSSNGNEDLNAEMDGLGAVEERPAVAPPRVVERVGAAGDSEAETPAKRYKHEGRFRCDECGRAYCRAEGLRQHQARECDYLLAVKSARQEPLSVAREERRARRSTEQTVQVQTISKHIEKAEGEKSKANDNLHFHAQSLEQQIQQYRGANEMAQGALRGLANPRPTQPSSTPGTTVTAGHQPQVMRPTCPTNVAGKISQRQIAHEPASAGGARSAAVAQSGAARGSEVRATPAKENKIVRLVARKYPCSECKKKYRTRVSLQKHKTLYCGKPPIECKGCRQLFQPMSHRKHLKSGSCTEGVPYKCEHCTTFSTLFKHSLVMHVRSCELRREKRLAELDTE